MPRGCAHSVRDPCASCQERAHRYSGRVKPRGFRCAIGLALASTTVGCALFDWATSVSTDAGDASDAGLDAPLDGDAGSPVWTCESLTSDPDIQQKLPAIVPIDLPPNTHVVSVAASDDLQQKINAAKPGDVLELEAGAT